MNTGDRVNIINGGPESFTPCNGMQGIIIGVNSDDYDWDVLVDGEQDELAYYDSELEPAGNTFMQEIYSMLSEVNH